jgi:hypothetical protein
MDELVLDDCLNGTTIILLRTHPIFDGYATNTSTKAYIKLKNSSFLKKFERNLNKSLVILLVICYLIG